MQIQSINCYTPVNKMQSLHNKSKYVNPSFCKRRELANILKLCGIGTMLASSIFVTSSCKEIEMEDLIRTKTDKTNKTDKTDKTDKIEEVKTDTNKINVVVDSTLNTYRYNMDV